jgi:hypothetical protein
MLPFLALAKVKEIGRNGVIWRIFFHETHWPLYMTYFHRHRVVILLAVAAVLLKFFSGNERWVERYYTLGAYPFISEALRALFGWIPFSVGDVLYVAAGAYLVYESVRAVKVLLRKGGKRAALFAGIEKSIRGLLVVYLLFNTLWGLNYDREGVAPQLGITVASYNTDDLEKLVRVLQDRICYDGDHVNAAHREHLNSGQALLQTTLGAYAAVSADLPYLVYRRPSVKPSLLSPLGPYFGFTGYYNPFTAEAQVNTAVPFFVKPFVMAHEMAHQLGYAKENEANFVSYLVLRRSADPELRYSVYFEMHAYALAELLKRDPVQAWLFAKTVHPQYDTDYAAYLAYLNANRNSMEPVISRFYDRYLKLNNQPAGKATYNLVVAWLVGYMKKFGEDAL